MAKFFLLGLLCVMVVVLDATQKPYEDYDSPSFENDEPAELVCDPPCRAGLCCTAQLPLVSYICVKANSPSAVGKACHEGKCGQPCECCIRNVKVGRCYRASSRRCMNPARFAIASNCCPKGKVCKASRKTSLFGRCRTP